MSARIAPLLVALALGGCGSDSVSPPADAPGQNVLTPVPIDRGSAGASVPRTYKGLPLRLSAGSEPVVTAVRGVIGVVCVGMSNGNQECSEFIQRLALEWSVEVNPQVRVVNCAVGGHAIERWIDPAFDAPLWDDCAGWKLGVAGVSADQVRVLYHKAANQFTTAPGGGPKRAYPAGGSDYEAFLTNLDAFAARVSVEFPSVQAVYTSSRSYGGFAINQAARGEPLSYEEGHALNTWLAAHPVVGSVWYGWGAYLWAGDCPSGLTNGAGVCYDRPDYVDDGVHPSATGRVKIARLMHERLLQHAWYRQP